LCAAPTARINSIIASGSLGRTVNLDALARSVAVRRVGQVTYDPRSHIKVKIRVPVDGRFATVQVFATGSLTVNSLVSEDQVRRAVSAIWPAATSPIAPVNAEEPARAPA